MLSERITALFAAIVIASTSVCASFGAYADDELKGVVNKGESYAFNKDKWVDVSEIIDDIRAQLKNADIDSNAQIDNFPIRAYTEPAVVRFAGSTRFDTAAKISSESKLFEQSDTVIIANGMDHADALAGGVNEALKKAPMFLVSETLTKQQTDYLKFKNTKQIVVFGGTGAVSDKTVEIISNAKQ